MIHVPQPRYLSSFSLPHLFSVFCSCCPFALEPCFSFFDRAILHLCPCWVSLSLPRVSMKGRINKDLKGLTRRKFTSSLPSNDNNNNHTNWCYTSPVHRFPFLFIHSTDNGQELAHSLACPSSSLIEDMEPPSSPSQYHHFPRERGGIKTRLFVVVLFLFSVVLFSVV